MGWMADKQAEMGRLLEQVIAPLVPAGETLQGCVYANQQGRLSAKLYAVGVSDHHLILQEVDRKWNPKDPPVLATAGEIEVGNIFSEGAMFALGSKDQQIRFSAKGNDYKLMVLGGTLIENAFAGSAQVDGLQALAAFLRSTRH